MKSILICLFISLSCLTRANVDTLSNRVERDSIVGYAQSLLGSPYLWGGTTQKGFDCSGFVYHVFKRFNIVVSRTSRGYKDKGTNIELEMAKPGDIILFTGTNSAVKTIGHIGIILSNTNGAIDFIHSSSSKKHFGVTITRYNNSGYVKRFLKTINIIS